MHKLHNWRDEQAERIRGTAEYRRALELIDDINLYRTRIGEAQKELSQLGEAASQGAIDRHAGSPVEMLLRLSRRKLPG